MSAWGQAWGVSWGVSWGPIGVAPVQEVVLGGQRLFRVRLGPLSGVAQADQLAADITAAGMDLPRIVIE